MSANTDVAILSQKHNAANYKKVACIFCGLPTPVHSAPLNRHENQGPSIISIVRCRMCGKEAPYRSCDIFEFSEMHNEQES